MSGHSHWSTIKRQKGVEDQKRGKIFSKLAKAISLAAGNGSDPAKNFKLRLAIGRAKEFNMPKENVKRAIEKGSGRVGAAGLKEITYEGYGPEGAAVIVETVTDNRNRTTAEIKNIFERGGGSLASPGAVSFQFKKAGKIVIQKKEKIDEQILKLIDLGVADVEEVEDGIEVYTRSKELNAIKTKIEEASFRIITAEIASQPKMPLKVDSQEKKERILKFIELLEEHEDVQKIYTNILF